MAAETPRAIAASGGGGVGDFARSRTRGGVDGFAVVIAVGLVVIEGGFVQGGVRVGVGVLSAKTAATRIGAMREGKAGNVIF
jgi:hypothetical protein